MKTLKTYKIKLNTNKLKEHGFVLNKYNIWETEDMLGYTSEEVQEVHEVKDSDIKEFEYCLINEELYFNSKWVDILSCTECINSEPCYKDPINESHCNIKDKSFVNSYAEECQDFKGKL